MKLTGMLPMLCYTTGAREHPPEVTERQAMPMLHKTHAPIHDAMSPLKTGHPHPHQQHPRTQAAALQLSTQGEGGDVTAAHVAGHISL